MNSQDPILYMDCLRYGAGNAAGRPNAQIRVCVEIRDPNTPVPPAPWIRLSYPTQFNNAMMAVAGAVAAYEAAHGPDTTPPVPLEEQVSNLRQIVLALQDRLNQAGLAGAASAIVK